MGLLIMIKFIKVLINNMFKINIVNLVMLIVTMVKFMAKPIMSQLVMVKLIMLN
jgi:hypothetical protein